MVCGKKRTGCHGQYYCVLRVEGNGEFQRGNVITNSRPGISPASVPIVGFFFGVTPSSTMPLAGYPARRKAYPSTLHYLDQVLDLTDPRTARLDFPPALTKTALLSRLLERRRGEKGKRRWKRMRWLIGEHLFTPYGTELLRFSLFFCDL